MSQTKPSNYFQIYHQKSQLKNTPVILSNSFQNLEKPLEYIKNDHLQELDNISNRIKEQIKRGKEEAFELSKLNYKKVVGRDKVDYKFGLDADIGRNPNEVEDLSISTAKKQDNDIREKQLKMKQNLKIQFLHGEQNIALRKQKNNLMNYDIIRHLDDQDYSEKFKHIQFGDIFLKNQKQAELQKFHNVYDDITDNLQLEDQFSHLNQKFIEKDSHFSEQSQTIFFKAEQQMEFWRRNNSIAEQQITDEEIMSRCQALDLQFPTFYNMLDFALERISLPILEYYIKIKTNRKTQMELNQNQQNIEEEYYKKKREFELLKEHRLKDKNKKIMNKPTEKEIQTINVLDQQQYDSYFEEGCKDLLLQLKDMNIIRQNIIKGGESKQNKQRMLINICQEIKSLLFKILTLILYGENFPQYAELMSLDDKNLAENKILELIYLHADKMQVPSVDGMPKITLLNVYLEEREKNEKIFGILGKMVSSSKEEKKKADKVSYKRQLRTKK